MSDHDKLGADCDLDHMLDAIRVEYRKNVMSTDQPNSRSALDFSWEMLRRALDALRRSP